MYEINIIEVLVANQNSYVVEESITGTPIVISNSEFYIGLPLQTQDAVTYSPQAKTEAEKLNARNNIDAVGKEPGKGLSEENFTKQNKNDLEENTVSRHWHDNLEVLKELTQSDILQISVNKEDLEEILKKIPTQATESNKLADKAFVNSSINSITADYITADEEGNAFSNKASLLQGPYYNKGQIVTLSKNDYALVSEDETKDGASVRYVYDGSLWAFQYIVNDTPLTAEQLAALNSGITKDKVDNIPVEFIKSVKVDDSELIITDNNDKDVVFEKGNNLDERTIVKNNKNQIECKAITNGTDYISFEDIYNSMTITREVK